MQRIPAQAGTCTVMIALAGCKRKNRKLKHNLASAFTGTAYLLYIDQPVFAPGAELQSLGAIAVVGNNFSRAITLLTKDTDTNSAGTATVRTWHQEDSILLCRNGLYITTAVLFAGFLVENLLRH